MSTFFWSDLHVGHVNLAEKYRPSFGGTVPAHNALVQQRWNDTVRPTDEVWIIGDAAMGKRTETVPFFASLHGVKHLVSGNHDDTHPMYAHKVERHARQLELYAEFFTIHEHIITPERVEALFGWRDVVIAHFPFWGSYSDHAEEAERGERYKRWHPHVGDYPLGTVNIHGHTHSTEQMMRCQIHVGVDAWPDGPVSADTVGFMIAASRAFL